MKRLRRLRGTTFRATVGMAAALAAGLGIARVPARAAGASVPPIRIENFRFEPPELVVERGSVVAWVNRDEELHAVVAADGSFASPGLDTDGRYTHAFDVPGRYEYRCALHPQMTGTIVVR